MAGPRLGDRLRRLGGGWGEVSGRRTTSVPSKSHSQMGAERDRRGPPWDHGQFSQPLSAGYFILNGGAWSRRALRPLPAPKRALPQGVSEARGWPPRCRFPRAPSGIASPLPAKAAPSPTPAGACVPALEITPFCFPRDSTPRGRGMRKPVRWRGKVSRCPVLL